MATLMLTMAGDTKTLWEKWISHFMKRNPHIASLIEKLVDGTRIWGTQQQLIVEFYEPFDTI